jgi:hypothetical protein
VAEQVQIAALVLVEAALRLIQEDPHHWSNRPCATCRAVGAIVDRPFGCYLYAQQRAARASLAQGKTEGNDG